GLGVAEQVDEPFHDSGILTCGKRLDGGGMARMSGVAKNSAEDCVINRSKQQERVQDLAALVLRVSPERLLERIERLMAGERWVVGAGGADAACPLGEVLK